MRKLIDLINELQMDDVEKNLLDGGSSPQRMCPKMMASHEARESKSLISFGIWMQKNDKCWNSPRRWSQHWQMSKKRLIHMQTKKTKAT